MKIFYYCFAGSHSSIIAGHIHLGQLPMDRVATISEIYQVKGFDCRHQKELGIPFFLGKDEEDNEIYAIGMGKNRSLALQAIYYLLQDIANPAEWKFYDTVSEINLLTRIGGFISGTLGWSKVGRPIVALGIQRCYGKLINVVKHSKEWNH